MTEIENLIPRTFAYMTEKNNYTGNDILDSK